MIYKYGNAPVDVGLCDLLPFNEVMYYLYLPLKLAGQEKIGALEHRLRPIAPLLLAIYNTVGKEAWVENNIYVTAKRMFCGQGSTPNRPGWHADGFGTDDLNFIWYDCVPTIFNVGDHFNITEDHVTSLVEFDEQATARPDRDVVYPVRHLLRLDSSVVHRVADTPADQVMRTFIKISLSKDAYNLKDNSRNPDLKTGWQYHDRAMVRNHPQHAQKDSYNVVDDHLI